MSNEIKQNFERRIESLSERIKKLPKETFFDEIQSDLSKYLCILVSGYFEKVFVNILKNFSELRTRKEIANFIFNSIKQSTNFNMEKVEKFLNNFSAEWVDMLKKNAKYDEFSNSLGSIYGNRNKIAHGESTTVWFKDLENHYKKIKELLEVINSIVNKS